MKCQEKFNIGFIVGGFQDPYFQESGKFRETIEFLKRLSNSFQANYDGVGVGLITYGSSAHVSFDLHPFITAEHLTKAIDESSAPDVGGNLEDGLEMSNEFWHYSLASRDKVSTIVVVSTDLQSLLDSTFSTGTDNEEMNFDIKINKTGPLGEQTLF